LGNQTAHEKCARGPNVHLERAYKVLSWRFDCEIWSSAYFHYTSLKYVL